MFNGLWWPRAMGLGTGQVTARAKRGTIKYYVKNSIRNILHENIDVCTRILIADFPADEWNVFQNLSHIV